MIALIENDVFVRWVDLRSEFPDTSFPLPVKQEHLPDGVVLVETNGAPFVPGPLQVMERTPEPVLENGVWRLGYVVRDMTEDEARTATDLRADLMRSERTQRLTESDWTQLPDAPVDQPAWAAYRQGLRDITAQDGFPWTIVWPVQP